MDINLTLDICIIIVATFCTTLLILSTVYQNINLSAKKNIRIIDSKKLRIVLLLLISVSIGAIIVNWIYYGAIPVFSGYGVANINEEITKNIPILIKYFSDLLPTYVIYIGILYIVSSKYDIPILLLMSALMMMLILNGARLPFVLALLFSAIVVYPQVKSGRKYFIHIFILIAIIFVTLGVWRNRGTDKIAVSGFTTLIMSFGVEFSEFARLMAVLNNPVYSPSTASAKEIVMDNVLIPALPTEIWKIVGIDRTKYDKLTYVTFGALIYESTITGIRPGIFGEVYYGFGTIGVVLWTIVVTFLLFKFDVKRIALQRTGLNSFNLVIFSIWGNIIAVSVIFYFAGSVNFFSTSFLLFYLFFRYAEK
jgi:hypothetical protein